MDDTLYTHASMTTGQFCMGIQAPVVQSTRIESDIVSCPWTICHAKLSPSSRSQQRLSSQREGEEMLLYVPCAIEAVLA